MSAIIVFLRNLVLLGQVTNVKVEYGSAYDSCLALGSYVDEERERERERQRTPSTKGKFA